MGIANTAFRIFQTGLEADATPGTAVAATSKAAVSDIVFKPTDRFHRPKLAKGLATSNPGDEVVVVRGTEFTIPETELIYDQHHIWLAMSVLGDVAASGADPYIWTFVRNILADPDINTRTLERRLSDGTNNIDNEWAYAFLSEIRWIYEANSALRWSAKGFARRVQASTLTAGQSFPAVMEIPPSPLVTVTIDSTWANLGVTAIAGQVTHAEVTFTTGYEPKATFDGRSDLDYTTNLLNAANVGLDVTIRMLVQANSGQFATEKTAAEAGTLRAIRLDVVGTQSRNFRLNMLLKHDPASLQTIGSEDGQDMIEMKLVNATDGTNQFSVVCENKTNATS